MKNLSLLISCIVLVGCIDEREPTCPWVETPTVVLTENPMDCRDCIRSFCLDETLACDASSTCDDFYPTCTQDLVSCEDYDAGARAWCEYNNCSEECNIPEQDFCFIEMGPDYHCHACVNCNMYEELWFCQYTPGCMEAVEQYDACMEASGSNCSMYLDPYPYGQELMNGVETICADFC